MPRFSNTELQTGICLCFEKRARQGVFRPFDTSLLLAPVTVHFASGRDTNQPEFALLIWTGHFAVSFICLWSIDTSLSSEACYRIDRKRLADMRTRQSSKVFKERASNRNDSAYALKSAQGKDAFRPFDSATMLFVSDGDTNLPMGLLRPQRQRTHCDVEVNAGIRVSAFQYLFRIHADRIRWIEQS